MGSRRIRTKGTTRGGAVRAVVGVASLGVGLLGVGLLGVGARGAPCARAADAPAAPQPRAAPSRPPNDGTIVVRALRASGRPIVGALVFGYGCGPDRGPAVRRTDADGFARFGGLRDGECVVRVVDVTPGHTPLDEARLARLVSDRLEWIDGRPVRRRIESPRCDVEVVAPCRRVEGLALAGATREDVRGAEVRVFPGRLALGGRWASPSLEDAAPSRAVTLGTTDSRGRLDLCSDVEAGLVEVRAPGGRRGWAPFDGVRFLVPVAQDGIVRCVGRVVDETGAAVAGATVADADGFAGILDVPRPATVTDADGSFALDVPCLARSTVAVALPGSVPQTFTLRVRARASEPATLVVARTTAVRVAVVDAATGAPLPGVAVTLHASGRTAAGALRGPPTPGTTGDDGALRCPVAPGDVIGVRIEAPAYGVGEKLAAAAASGAVAAIEGDLDAVLSRGEERRVTVRLRRPVRASGTLVLPKGADVPAGTFAVRLAPATSPRSDRYRAAVRDDGTCSADVHEPVVVVGVDAPGFAWRADPPRSATDLGTVRLTPFGVFTGHVVDARGHRVRDATVRVVPRGDRARRVLATATTDADGAFVVPMAEGMRDVRIVASAPDRGIGSVPLVDAGPGGAVPVAMLVVPDELTARFRVLDASGAPLANVRVVDPGHRDAARDDDPTTDAAGFVEVAPPRDGTLGLLAPDGARYTFDVGTTDAEPVELRLPATRAVTLRLGPSAPDVAVEYVHVVRGSVRPADARLRVHRNAWIRDGTVLVTALDAGPALVHVARSGYVSADVEVPVGTTELAVTLEPITDAHRARATAIDTALAALPPLETIPDATARELENRRRVGLVAEWTRLVGL